MDLQRTGNTGIHRSLLAIAAGSALLALAWPVSRVLPVGTDFGVFYSAAQSVLIGQSPYSVSQYVTPPWSLLPVIPLALLPIQYANAVWFICAISAWIYIAYRLRASPVATVALLLSYPVVYGLHYGQIEWMAMVGLVLPPQAGLFLLLIKPQSGMAIAIFYLAKAWQSGGVRELLRVFGPVTVAFLLSFAVYGPWPLQGAFSLSANWNLSPWPIMIPAGLVLLCSAIQSKERRHAMAASPLLSPYVAVHSWAVALLSLFPDTTLAVTASAGSWLVFLLANL